MHKSSEADRSMAQRNASRGWAWNGIDIDESALRRWAAQGAPEVRSEGRPSVAEPRESSAMAGG